MGDKPTGVKIASTVLENQAHLVQWVMQIAAQQKAMSVAVSGAQAKVNLLCAPLRAAVDALECVQVFAADLGDVKANSTPPEMIDQKVQSASKKVTEIMADFGRRMSHSSAVCLNAALETYVKASAASFNVITNDQAKSELSAALVSRGHKREVVDSLLAAMNSMTSSTADLCMLPPTVSPPPQLGGHTGAPASTAEPSGVDVQ